MLFSRAESARQTGKIVWRSVRKRPSFFKRCEESRNPRLLARKRRARARTGTLYPHVKMAALSAVAPVLNKAPVVSTGKAANTNSMMVWQPHGNKCVSPPGPARASPSNETMLVLKLRLFPRSRLATRRATRSGRRAAPTRRAATARSPRATKLRSIVVA